MIFFIWFYFLIPDNLFQTPSSTVVYGSKNELLGAKIAKDGQWRFPQSDSVPKKFQQLILLFEDEYFHYHPGVNPFSITKALWQNLQSGSKKRGGSTLTMQLARMARGNKSRNGYQKFIEILWALRIEGKYSKDEILNLYTSNAPFGGNVVGLSAASWRYYGREPSQLSWGEMAALAILPNAPALIFPGKNQDKLLLKRNRLLKKLYTKKIISKEDYELAVSEPLPGKPLKLPSSAQHLLQYFEKIENKVGKKINSTVNEVLQERILNQLKQYQSSFAQNEIHNLAAIVVEVKSGKVISYIGNVSGNAKNKGEDVDVIQAPRSSGSIIKPLLYAAIIDEGIKLPNALVDDIPFSFMGYTPQNNELSFDGLVPMSHALTRSLNIPFVLLLSQYGVQKFLDKLNELGFSSLNRPSDNYGLSLILGGGEIKLFDLVKVYRKIAFELQYSGIAMDAMNLAVQESEKSSVSYSFSKSAIWHTFETMSNVNRPRTEQGWQQFLGGRKLAWKTGTSFGHRDAWAVGVSPEYVVGVWVGNASGEGRPDLTGLNYAGPVLFRIFKLLPTTSWFSNLNDLKTVQVCAESGYKKGENCTKTISLQIHEKGLESKVCPYHQILFLDESGNNQVNANCYPVEKMLNKSFFVIPPLQAFFYQNKSAEYLDPPPFLSGCLEVRSTLQILYPTNHSKVFVPRNLKGEFEKIVMEAYHNQRGATLFWHIDGQFLTSTVGKHKVAIRPSSGIHVLTIVDNNGNEQKITFEAVER